MKCADATNRLTRHQIGNTLPDDAQLRGHTVGSPTGYSAYSMQDLKEQVARFHRLGDEEEVERLLGILKFKRERNRKEAKRFRDRRKLTMQERYERDKRRVMGRRIRLIRLFGGKCRDCDGKFHPAAMHFHHTRDKLFSLCSTRMLQGWGILVREAEKCILLCANCHAVQHSGYNPRPAKQNTA